MKHRYFEAESIGVLVTEISREGEVSSLYDEAVNILFEKGMFVSLVRNRDRMSALSVQVPALFGISQVRSCPYSVRLKPGTGVRLQEKRLILEDLSIGFNKALRWPGVVCPEDIEGFGLNSIQLLEEALLARGKEGGLLAILSPGSASSSHANRAEDLLKNILLRGVQPILTGLSGFVGLGPGFTPSGDDFLCGMLLGEKTLIEAGYVTEEQSKTGHGIATCPVKKGESEAMLDGTTPGGKTLLWQALQGRFPFYLLEAVRGISAARNARQMQKAVERAVAHGETSGTDALVGLLWYFKYAFDIL